MPPLLPQQIAPVDARQQSLTERHLTGRNAELTGYFLALRAEADKQLAPTLPPAAGKAYPYGRCEEITREVFTLLNKHLQQAQTATQQTLHDFTANGGIVRTVWGVLREQYFQNALQLGGLYVDVANDTVDVNKPKVEILPMAASGLVCVQDLAHFRRIAAAYWGATLYANHLIPSLAPLLPIVSVSPGRLKPGLQSACDYMIALMCRDNFAQAETWLSDGPPPPADVARAVLSKAPADLHPWSTDNRQESINACRRARAAGCQSDSQWRDARVLDYLRTRRQ